MNLPKSELTNEKIDRADMMYFMERDDVRKLWDALDQPQTYFRFADKLKPLIHQAEIKARLDELVKLKNAHSINIFDEYLENHIQALEKEIVL